MYAVSYGGFPLCHRFHEDLNMIAITGTSDQPCWLAKACKILLLFFFCLWLLGTMGIWVRCTPQSKLGPDATRVVESSKSATCAGSNCVLGKRLWLYMYSPI